MFCSSAYEGDFRAKEWTLRVLNLAWVGDILPVKADKSQHDGTVHQLPIRAGLEARAGSSFLRGGGGPPLWRTDTEIVGRLDRR